MSIAIWRGTKPAAPIPPKRGISVWNAQPAAPPDPLAAILARLAALEISELNGLFESLEARSYPLIGAAKYASVATEVTYRLASGSLTATMGGASVVVTAGAPATVSLGDILVGIGDALELTLSDLSGAPAFLVYTIRFRRP